MLTRYAHWLHLRWPAGEVEPLPEVEEDGTCVTPGVRIVGDLKGAPHLKHAADSGAQAVQDILGEAGFTAGAGGDALDLVILGGGVSGISAALEAERSALHYAVIESSGPFSTVANYPARKPIFTYPPALDPRGLQLRAKTREALLEELESQRIAAGIRVTPGHAERIEKVGGQLHVHLQDAPPLKTQRVIVALGRSGKFRRLEVEGEDLSKVSNRLHDPAAFKEKDLLVVGGGDSALEAAVACADAGARVTLSYRRDHFHRAKPGNVAALESQAAEGRLQVLRSTTVDRIEADRVHLAGEAPVSLPNDAVLTLIGRKAPLDFFRASGISIRGEWTPSRVAGLALFLAGIAGLYSWKGSGVVNQLFREQAWFPYSLTSGLGASEPGATSLAGILGLSTSEPGFFYSLAYCIVVVVFGIRRIQRRKTPYIRVQTATLAAVQCVPLFLLPYILLPWLGAGGAFEAGLGQSVADLFFPMSDTALHGREYWRAFGFILAWPLFIWNVFTPEPLLGWLVVSVIQTFVVIPLIVHRWGKGAYCGWICSCGALAETLGDTHRHKMPHGEKWNRLNFLGQVILAGITVLLVLRVAGWVSPALFGPGTLVGGLFSGALSGFHLFGIPLNYAWLVDTLMAGILGVGLYFWFSGRTWCRFACPLAALMNIYARFSKFRIFSEKDRCISCNVCTTVCHQGIDVMSFANQGIPMEDPQCVRCSACIQSCPTATLSFGRLEGGEVVLDLLEASPIRMGEGNR